MGRVSESACVCALRCPPSLPSPHLPSTHREARGAREEEKTTAKKAEEKGIQNRERNKLQLPAAAGMCGSPARFPPSSSAPVGGTGKCYAATVRRCCPGSRAGVVAVKQKRKKTRKRPLHLYASVFVLALLSDTAFGAVRQPPRNEQAECLVCLLPSAVKKTVCRGLHSNGVSRPPPSPAPGLHTPLPTADRATRERREETREAMRRTRHTEDNKQAEGSSKGENNEGSLWVSLWRRQEKKTRLANGKR